MIIMILYIAVSFEISRLRILVDDNPVVGVWSEGGHSGLLGCGIVDKLHDSLEANR